MWMTDESDHMEIGTESHYFFRSSEALIIRYGSTSHVERGGTDVLISVYNGGALQFQLKIRLCKFVCQRQISQHKPC